MSTTTATAYKPTESMCDLGDIVKGFNVLRTKYRVCKEDYADPYDAIEMRKSESFDVDFTDWVSSEWTIPTADRFMVKLPVDIDECHIDVRFIPGGSGWVDGKYLATYQLEEVEWA